MRLYRIADELKHSGRYVFTIRDLSRVLGSSREVASVYAHRMKAKGLIYDVEKGKFSLGEDPFLVASQVVSPSYLSFSTALYLHGRMQQVIDRIYAVTSRKRNDLNFMGTDIEFIRFSPERIFGYRRHRKRDSYIFLADLEKAAVDSLYMPRYVPVSHVYEALSEGFDRKLMEEYARRMGSEAVIRRTGYILEVLGEDTDLRPSGRTIYRLNPHFPSKGRYISSWRLYANEAIG